MCSSFLSRLLVYFFSVFRVPAPPASSLLLKFESTLLSICAPSLFPELRAMFLAPLVTMFGVPPVMHPAHFVRISSTPFTHVRAAFAGMVFAPFALPVALIFAPLSKVFLVPVFLVLALVGAVAGKPRRIGESALPRSSAPVRKILVRHGDSIALCCL